MKIFVTVGSMLPFDRLVVAMDEWARDRQGAEVFAQIGESSFRPSYVCYRTFVHPAEYRERCASCDVIVSHVGMGTVITAFECNKPLLMLPRRKDLSEVTSDHQLATAKWLEGRAGIRIVYSERELAAALSPGLLQAGSTQIESGTRTTLVAALQRFISG